MLHGTALWFWGEIEKPYLTVLASHKEHNLFTSSSSKCYRELLLDWNFPCSYNSEAFPQ